MAKQTAEERHAELIKKIDGFRGLLDKVQQNQVAIGVIETRLDAHRIDIDKQEKRVDRWGKANAVYATVAGVIGFIFGPRQ